MRIDVFTVFPSLMDALCAETMLGKARTSGLLDLHLPRENTSDAHRTVDDAPLGGGAGMVLRAILEVRCLPPCTTTLTTVANLCNFDPWRLEWRSNGEHFGGSQASQHPQRRRVFYPSLGGPSIEGTAV